MIKEALRKVFGFVPVSRWEFRRVLKYIDDVFEAIEVADTQHGQVEKGMVDQIGKIINMKIKGEKEEVNDDVAFN